MECYKASVDDIFLDVEEEANGGIVIFSDVEEANNGGNVFSDVEEAAGCSNVVFSNVERRPLIC